MCKALSSSIWNVQNRQIKFAVRNIFLNKMYNSLWSSFEDEPRCCIIVVVAVARLVQDFYKISDASQTIVTRESKTEFLFSNADNS